MQYKEQTWRIGENPIRVTELQARADRGARIHLRGDGPFLTIGEFVPDEKAAVPDFLRRKRVSP